MRGRVAGAGPRRRRWPAGCSRRCAPATRRAATGAGGRARRCWWWPGAGGYGGTSDVVVDLRVDDHPDPVPELARLLDMHELLFGKPDPADAARPRPATLAAEVRGGWLAARGHDGRRLSTTALASWAGVENLEERMVPGRIDPLVLAHLRGASSEAARATRAAFEGRRADFGGGRRRRSRRRGRSACTAHRNRSSTGSAASISSRVHRRRPRRSPSSSSPAPSAPPA